MAIFGRLNDISVQKTKVLKILFFPAFAFVLLLYGAAEANASTDADPSLNTIGRSMYVNIWHFETKGVRNFTAENTQEIITKLKYMNVDHVVLQLGTCAFLHAMDPNAYSGWGVPTKEQITRIISQFHAAGITVSNNYNPTYRRATGDGCSDVYLNKFGNFYPKSIKTGAPIITARAPHAADSHTDLGYPLAREKIIDLLEYIIKNYDFDGIHLEEPNFYNADLRNTNNFQETWGTMYKAESGNSGFTPSMLDTDSAIKQQVALQKAKSLNLFLKELRERVNGLGPNYTYPYFSIEAMTNAYYFNTNNYQYTNGLGFGSDIKTWSENKYIDRFTSESTGYASPEKMIGIWSTLSTNTPGIYRAAVAYIQYGDYGTNPPPYLHNQITGAQSHGMSSELVFSYGDIKNTKIDGSANPPNRTTWCADNYANRNTAPYNTYATWTSTIVNGNTVFGCIAKENAYEYLHRTPPAINRAFNPIGKTSTSTSTPTCTDSIQNQGETGIDCGGPCPACSASPTQLTLKPGWNQISSPVAAGINLATMEQSCTILPYKNQKLWAWNAQTQVWTNPAKVEPFKGYWIYAAYQCTVPLSGTQATFTSLQLYNGWNKISASGTFSAIQGTCANHITGNWVWNWDKATEKWIHPATMQLDKGYWIKVDQGCVLSG